MILTDELIFQYRRCDRKAFLNYYCKEDEKPQPRDFVAKLKQENILHCQNLLNHLQLSYQQPQTLWHDTSGIIAETLELMAKGAECIYDGKLSTFWYYDLNLPPVEMVINPTLLIRQNQPSHFGNWSYRGVNCHLGKNPKPEYKLISALQTAIIGDIQGNHLNHGEFVVRSLKIHRVSLAIWLPKVKELVKELVILLQSQEIPEVFVSRQKCHLCNWHDDCYSSARHLNHLSLIPGITPQRYQLLVNQGIKDFESLAELSAFELAQIIDHPTIADNLYLQVRALKLNQGVAKIFPLPTIPHSTIELYFDIEAEPERNLDYLLGVLLVDHEQQEQRYYYFLAKDKTEEGKAWGEFLQFMEQWRGALVYHYSEYEVETIKRLAHLYHTPPAILQPLLSRLVDVHKIITRNYVLPVESYSLKSLAKWLNFHWRTPETGEINVNGRLLGGDQCVVWYDQWLTTGNPDYLQYILTYNEDDCRATYVVKNWLQNQGLVN
ncbi:MAG: TM0106 family RecB-like putative nuclease [Cyanobacterium sp. T60_A2020_053]|nr:TM0106 family RecB-like putative nuclease [Cyanobacterium sp. T60_A2020_053]